MCDVSPQQSYAVFAAHQDRLHTPTRLVFCYPATEHSLQMARDRVTDALYDLNTPMAVIAKWLTYIEDAAPDMAVDEVWAWAVLDWSELILALDDDDVCHAFVDMSHALYVRGVECDLDDAILDAFKEAHIQVAQTLAGKSSHAKLNKMLKSWWSSPIVPPSVISNGNLANGNPILGNTQPDHAIAYPRHQRAFYRSVVTYAWQAATEQRLEASIYSVVDAAPDAMEAIAEQDVPHVDADTCAETLSDVDVDSCTYTSPSTAPAVPDSASLDAPVDIYESSSLSVVAKWPLEPLVKDSGVWSVMELLAVAPVAELAYRPSWLERCTHQAVQGETHTAVELDGVPRCDLSDGSLLSQRRHSDADSLCSLTTIPFSDEDEDEFEELTAPVPCGKTLVAPLGDWMTLRDDGQGNVDDDDSDCEWDVCAPVTKKPHEPLPWFVDAVELKLSNKPDCISMMDESLRVNVFADESEGIESEFNRLVCEIKRRRLVAP